MLQAGKRLETTLLTSRKCLRSNAPHHRLYSSPTSSRQAAAAAAAVASAQVPNPDYPVFLTRMTEPEPFRTTSKDIGDFLKRGVPRTVLPTPRPADSKSESNKFWFIDTPTQDALGVMDACLHDCFDVPRAKVLFDRMREKGANPTLETKIYNAFLEAYLRMAGEPKEESKEYWLESAWTLYDAMENGKEVDPNATTYAVMLILWYRHHKNELQIPDSLMRSKRKMGDQQKSYAQHPGTLLTSLLHRDIRIDWVVSDRMFSSSIEALNIIKLLSSTAVELNLTRIVSDLGRVETLGSEAPDILDSVPEAMPVLRKKKKAVEAVTAEDGSKSTTETGTIEEDEFEVPFNLDNLRRHLAEVCYARRVLPEDVAARQKLLEESVYDVAVERLKKESELFEELGIGGSLRQRDLQRWMWEWHGKLTEKLETVIKDITTAEKDIQRKSHIPLGPYLSLVRADRLSLITILELMRMQGSGGVSMGMKTTRALMTIGNAVELEYKAQMCRRNNIYVPMTSGRPPNASFFSNMGYNHLLERRVVAAKYMSDGESWTIQWTPAIRAKIGGILVECLMDVAQVTRTGVDKNTNEIIHETQPAFYNAYEHFRGQKLGVIKLNPVVSEHLAKDGMRGTLHPRHLPMLVKPKPWLRHDDGGYFYNKTHAMRYKDSVEQHSYLRHAAQLGNVELVFASLDVLGSTPWKINEKIFHIVLQVWNSGQRLGKVPPAVFDKPEPVKPPGELNVVEKALYLTHLKAYNQEKANNHSDRCSVNYKIEIARAFLGDTFYQPHNIDFRGRAYPIPPHLNHLGDDLSRGLLQFAQKKPLGERGLRWLKIHLANLYGYDKASFDEREQWAMDRLEHIYDSATNPLEGGKWWQQADDPWQCLACCMELHAALESPNPIEHQSALPIHQDGTCNGLQHYAALGGDAEGAAQVNLSAGDRPSDIYSHVGRMAEEMIVRDAEKGDKYALILKGRITRKVVKQTVMTTVYGVTFIGAREQIERQLRALDGVPPEDCWMAAAYLARVVLACIQNLFAGAKDIQIWLTSCANLIAKSIPGDRLPEALLEHQKRDGSKAQTIPLTRLKKEQMTSVVWTTPLGLPIVQPYRKPKRKQIMTAIQTVFIEDPNCPSAVNSQKQSSAFPPNFIHSLDATHMMLTALECQSQGLTYASVHDSYWTHACSVDKMSEIIRDTFIALHSSEVLVKLNEEFRERYKDYKIPLLLLRNSALTKRLRALGSKIVATPEQAETLRGVSTLLSVSETEASTLHETVSFAAGSHADAEEEAKALMESLEEDADEEDPQSSASRKKAENLARLAAELRGKFVDLIDVLPPLPEKGNFQVEDIKASPYFFS